MEAMIAAHPSSSWCPDAPRCVLQIASHSNKMGTFAHGFTYSGHPVACAVALEAVKMYQEMDIPAVVRDIEPMFQVLPRVLCPSLSDRPNSCVSRSEQWCDREAQELPIVTGAWCHARSTHPPTHPPAVHGWELVDCPEPQWGVLAHV